MKQMVTALQMANLSPVAKQRLFDWLKEKDYGSTQDGEFFPITQLTIGMMLEFINGDYKEKLCDELFNTVKELLEQKN